jgi:hypothetical protein
MGLMLFGLVYGYLTVCRWEVLQKSYFLAALGLPMLVGPRCSTLLDLLAHLRANADLSSTEGISRLENPKPRQPLENYNGAAFCVNLTRAIWPAARR